ncbi:hypothetical protein [Streptomyces lavendofoliae]|uniref:Uncharacterized protein n=1 Tax=Streptomyces lavendofoliae TaxID=67314 RepID=A0A918I4G9_9ACTN|nr:hypothetical protein [Streptomyces lavendofoliae]GGU62409.1 hypothetical protein GCM10010274_58990 [Streptomyces lavendofoliae]
MTPADELRTAAQTLMDLADTAQEDLDTADYWKPYDKTTAWRDGFVNGFGGACSDLVAVFTPATAHALAAWLRSEADRLTVTTHPGWQDTVAPNPLAVARAINGSSR